MKNTDIEIWDRKFSLKVEYDCYAGETITKQQTEAFKNFYNHPEWIKNAKTEVMDFCKDQVAKDDDIQNKDNIFGFIKPTGIFVKRDDWYPRVAIMCNYRCDPEHGLAIVFDEYGDVVIGPQDIIL